MRLTKKGKIAKYRCDYPKHTTTECIKKLGQLEDIEDELGISLFTLFDATFNGVYYITNGQIINTKDMGFSVAFYKDYLLIMDNELEHAFRTKDYGKTWALTKGELGK